MLFVQGIMIAKGIFKTVHQQIHHTARIGEKEGAVPRGGILFSGPNCLDCQFPGNSYFHHRLSLQT
jgi:hypothetical protein